MTSATSYYTLALAYNVSISWHEWKAELYLQQVQPTQERSVFSSDAGEKRVQFRHRREACSVQTQERSVFSSNTGEKRVQFRHRREACSVQTQERSVFSSDTGEK